MSSNKSSSSGRFPISTRDVPWLAVLHGKNLMLHSTAAVPTFARRCRLVGIPDYSDIIEHSPFGWLIFYRVIEAPYKATHFTLLNPATLETIRLPRLDANGLYTAVLTHPPTHPDCRLIAGYEKSPQLVHCKLADAKAKGSHCWVAETFLNVEPFWRLVVCQGTLYAITKGNQLFAIKEDSTSQKLVLSLLMDKGPHPLPNCLRYDRRLVESGGELLQLLLCYRRDHDHDIDFLLVFKLDKSGSSSSTYSWVQVKSLEGRAIFINEHATSLSCRPPAPGGGQKGPKPNCVYFFQYRFRTIAFDVETGQSSCFMLAPPLVDHYYDSPRFSMAFLSYDRGQTSTTTRHCSSGVVDQNGRAQQQAIGYHDEGDKVSKTTSILDLPLDMLHNITRRLVVVGDYRNLHASCKAFKSTAPLITSAASGGIALQSPSTYPWFFFFQQHTGSLHLHDLRCRNTFTDPQQLLPKPLSSNETTCIFFSKERWLLTGVVEEIMLDPTVDPMSRTMFQFTFWNPFTKEVCNLPWMRHPPSPISIGISDAPTSPHCSIMGVAAANTKDYGVWFHFMKLDEGQWHYMEDKGLNFQPSHHNIPVFLDDKFYFLDKKRKLGVFSCRRDVEGQYEWERDVYPWKLLPKHVETLGVDPHDDRKFKREYLVECEGEIHSILVGDLGKSIQIYRFDREKKGWWKVKSLESHMVFVSETSCFSIVAKIPGMKNKIYFPRVSAKGSIVFYSLDTRKYHTFDYNDDAMDDFQASSEVHLCGWIEPKDQ